MSNLRRPPAGGRCGLVVTLCFAALLASSWSAPAVGAEGIDARITVYLIDHQMLEPGSRDTILSEIDTIFADAGIEVRWIPNQSPQRDLRENELRLIVLPSDGTRWFQGPSNAIGIAPHDDSGIGRNCFIFYRQAVWFRQQAMMRCREAVRARTQAEARGESDDSAAEELAPKGCGDQLPSLTSLIVARAAAHEMVHILLNKLEHSGAGLMRDSFELTEWLVDDAQPFRLRPEELGALRNLLVSDSAGDGAR